jgi:hypothetical protein
MCASLRATSVCLVFAFSIVSLVNGGSQRKGPARANLLLTVRKPGDRTREIPGSSLYVLDLLNNSDKTQRFEVIQMPGGYAGSGRFFNCGLQAWSTGQRAWVPLRREKRSDYDHNPIENAELKPGEKLEVCANLLPSQAGSAGQCVRFTLRRLWSDNSSEIFVSKPFSIGEKVAAQGSPCLVK